MLTIVLLTALGVGGATMLGALAGYLFRGMTARISPQLVMAFAAGIMLCAAIAGLILPSLEGGGAWAVPMTAGGILCGGGFLLTLEALAARLHRLSCAAASPQARRALLLLAAMAIHDLPESLAAGVGFGTESLPRALAIAGGIALQNVPEGMVLIAPLLLAGIPPRRTLWLSMSTGVVEIAGTLLGYGAAALSAAVLPFLLSFAGGAMLCIICQDMIPDSSGHRAGTPALLAGFCLMLALEHCLG